MRLTSALDMLMQQCDTQVLVMGKISQAAIVAGAAYRNEDTFKLQTGITKTRLIKDKIHHDTKVHGLQDTACCAIMPTTQKGLDHTERPSDSVMVSHSSRVVKKQLLL